MSKATWKQIDTIDIVYQSNRLFGVELDGVTYRKAYIVTHGDKAMMESAVSWAGPELSETGELLDIPPKTVTTANEGFTFRIAQAANTSFNSGKLSFWMCVFEKDGIEPFAAGINAELLYLLIMQSTLVEGRLLKNKVFFVRRDGQLGALHDKMPAYQEFKAACSTRDSMARNKTSKWQPGNIYATVTLRDVMFADMVMPLRFHERIWNNRILHGGTTATDIYILDFDASPIKLFGHTDNWAAYACGISLKRGDQDDQLDEFEEALVYAMFQSMRDQRKKCPSRHCEGPAPFANRVNKSGLTDALDKICILVLNAFMANTNFRRDWAELLSYNLILCEWSPERGLAALDRLDAAISTSKHPHFPENFVLRSGNTEQEFKSEEMVRYIIREAKSHYASRV